MKSVFTTSFSYQYLVLFIVLMVSWDARDSDDDDTKQTKKLVFLKENFTNFIQSTLLSEEQQKKVTKTKILTFELM